MSIYVGEINIIYRFYTNMLWYFQLFKSLLLKPLDQWKIGIVKFNKIIFERTWDVLTIHVGVLKLLILLTMGSKLRQTSKNDADKLSPD